MQTLILNIKNKEVSDKIIWLLKHFEDGEIEIIKKEDIEDLKLLAKTRNEPSIPFEEYLQNEDQY